MQYSVGNKKLGRDTAIINFTSATDCPSKKLGLCKVCGICYALKSEKRYPACLPYRRRQAEAWQMESVESIKANLAIHKGQYVRFSEAGDFTTQADIAKLYALAEAMPEKTFYGYTARQDLSFANAPHNVVVNGSSFTVHNQFKAVAEYSPNAIACVGDCRDCNLCKVRTGKTVEVKYH